MQLSFKESIFTGVALQLLYHKNGGGGIGKENFAKVFVGHGWKHYGTWEIDKNGKRLPLEYYHNTIGVSPDNYYFDSNTKLTIYYRSNTAGSAIKKSEVAYTFNRKYKGTSRTVLLLDNKKYIQITGWTRGEQPTFCMVHPLGVKSNGETLYGVSIYVQMTDTELKSMQESVSYLCQAQRQNCHPHSSIPTIKSPITATPGR